MEVGVMGAENVVGSATTGAGGLGIILDVAVVVIMLIFAIVSAKKGFIESIFGLLTTVVAIVAAVFLANIVVDATGGLFGLKDSIHSGMLGFLEGIEGFNTDISKDGLAASLQGKLPEFVITAIVAEYGVDVPAGTTIAMQLATPATDFILFIIAGIILFIIAKLALAIVKNILVGIVGAIGILNAVDKLLGFVLGVLQGVLCIGALFMIVSFIPAEGITSFIDSSMFAHIIYHNNPLQIVLGLVL